MPEDTSTEDIGHHERARDDRGRFTSNVSPEDVLNVMEPNEPYSTKELANRIGIPKRTTLKYLNELADQERIRKKRHTKRQITWIRPATD